MGVVDNVEAATSTTQLEKILKKEELEERRLAQVAQGTDTEGLPKGGVSKSVQMKPTAQSFGMQVRIISVVRVLVVVVARVPVVCCQRLWSQV